MRKITIEKEVYKYSELDEYTQNEVIERICQELLDAYYYKNRVDDKRTGVYKAIRKSEDNYTPWSILQCVYEYNTNKVMKIAKQNEYFKNGTIYSERGNERSVWL